MKNFEMQCPIDGTSALQPEFGQVPASAGTIIEFPGRVASCSAHAAPQHAARAIQPTRKVQARRFEATAVRSLYNGTARGSAYGRVEPWQAVVVGCLFSALAFTCIFLGL